MLWTNISTESAKNKRDNPLIKKRTVRHGNKTGGSVNTPAIYICPI
jgi:hypothetical protein